MSTEQHPIVPRLAVVILLITFSLVGTLIFYPVAAEQKDVVMFALGFITSAATQVISYYFGSSQSSRDKTNDLVRILKSGPTQ